MADLESHIPVDVYGECGKFKCGKPKTMRNSYKLEQDECYENVSRTYKFVLAMENSLCKDYVTEKLYNNLRLNVIPIVFGGGNYSIVAPPMSVININDFKSPKELAKFLYYLDSNNTAYNEFFAWKSKYFVYSRDSVPLVCDLCEKVSKGWDKERVYSNFAHWAKIGCKKGYNH